MKFTSYPTSAVNSTVQLNQTFTYSILDQASNVLFRDQYWVPFKDLVAPTYCSASEIRSYGSSYSCMRAKCAQLTGIHMFNTFDYTCHYTMYPTEVCVKMIYANSTANSTGWTPQTGLWAADKGGCYFPTATVFGTTTMTTSYTYSTNAVVRHAKDPFVIASQLTSGTLYFGATAGENARAGLALVIVGSIITGLVVMCVIGTLRCVRECTGRQPMYRAVAPGEAAYIVVKQPAQVQQAPAYGNAPPAAYGSYPAPPQGYAAPPQGYAVPPQGYAAPPQGYAAPPQGYAAPPQGYAYAPTAPPAQGY